MEERQRWVTDSLSAGGPASPRLRHREAHRNPFRGQPALPHRFAVSLALPARKTRLDSWSLGRKAQSKTAALLPSDTARSKDSGAAAPKLAEICRRCQPNHGG